MGSANPPRLVKSVPAQGSCHFQGRTLKLFFDKAVNVDQAQGKLTTSPALAVETESVDPFGYTCTSRGKVVYMTLSRPLEPDTTYTFHFNDMIKDTTEGNPAESIHLTFCTGATLDRMSVTGCVRHLMTDQPVEHALVGLCRTSEKIKNLWEQTPDYFVRTDAKGKFSLSHIKRGEYTLYATNSTPKRSKIDPNVDAYRVIKSIDLNEHSLENLTLRIVEADVRPLQIQRQGPFGSYFEVNFNKLIASYTLTVPSLQEDQVSPPVATLLEDGKTIRFYNTLGLLEEDHLPVVLTVTDHHQHTYSEELLLHFEEVDLVEKLSCHVLPKPHTPLPERFVIKLTVNTPIRSLRLDKMSFLLGDDTILPVKAPEVSVDEEKNEISITKSLSKRVVTSKSSNVTLRIEQGAIGSIEQTTNEALSYSYTIEPPKSFGTISGHVTVDNTSFIVQLLDANFEVLREVRDKRFYRFEHVVPGVYRVRVLGLQPEASDWNAGNFLEDKASDPVWVYPDPVGVIANWDIENIDFASTT